MLARDRREHVADDGAEPRLVHAPQRGLEEQLGGTRALDADGELVLGHGTGSLLLGRQDLAVRMR